MGFLSFLSHRGKRNHTPVSCVTSEYMGWFGKIPVMENFTSRGLPSHLQKHLQSWINDGLKRLYWQDHRRWEGKFMCSPVWRFAVNRGVWDKSAIIGCMMPSRDKLGRAYPLLALRTFNGHEEALHPGHFWLRKAEFVMTRIASNPHAYMSVVRFVQDTTLVGDELMATILGNIENVPEDDRFWPEENFSWPELGEFFPDTARYSFWWALPSGEMPRKIILQHKPDSEFFCTLMRGSAQSKMPVQARRSPDSVLGSGVQRFFPAGGVLGHG